MSVSTELDDLYRQVTEAIMKAELLEDARDPGARLAHSKVSDLEEAIANVVAANELEGEIARRGAVRAAMTAGNASRALLLSERYSADPNASRQLIADLELLVPAETNSETAADSTDLLFFEDPRLPLLAPPLDRPRIFVGHAVTGYTAATLDEMLAAVRGVERTIGRFYAAFGAEEAHASPKRAERADRVLHADAMVFLIGARGLPGVGQELAWAGARRIPILVLHISDVSPSALITDLPFEIELQSFNNPDDAAETVSGWIARWRSEIELGPHERRALELRLLPMQNQLRSRLFPRLDVQSPNSELALASVAKAVGVTPETLRFMLEDPLGIAAAPIRVVERLATLAGLTELQHREAYDSKPFDLWFREPLGVAVDVARRNRRDWTLRKAWHSFVVAVRTNK